MTKAERIRQSEGKRVRKGDIIIIPGKRGSFLVESAKMSGGGYGHGPGDIYPDAWTVRARRLYGSGGFNPRSKIFEFTQDTNCYNNCIDNVKIIGKMEEVITWKCVEYYG